MCRSALNLLLALVLTGLALPGQMVAQDTPLTREKTLEPPARPSEAFYVRTRLGAAAYGGDRSSFGESLNAPGPATGVEVGWRRRLPLFNGGFGILLLAGRYPSIADVPAGTSTVAQGELNMWRHTLALVGTTELLPRNRVTPYLRLGAGITGGLVDNRVQVAPTPLAGLGVDVALTDQVGLFVETLGVASLGDKLLDGAEGVGAGGIDLLSFFGAGVRIGLNPSFAPVDILAIEGPSELTVGELATFSVVARGDAAGPVTYTWQLGEGTEAQGAQVVHRFAEAGNYTISVTGQNEGSRDVQRLTVSVWQAEVPVPVVATMPAPERPVPAVVPGPSSGSPCADVVDLNTVRFAKNRVYFTAASWDALDENVAVMKACDGLNVRIQVYVAPDEREGLAERRAQAVEVFYTDRGIDASRIQAVQRVASSRVSGKDGLAQLRRVETIPTVQSVAQRTPEAGAKAGDR